MTECDTPQCDRTAVTRIYADDPGTFDPYWSTVCETCYADAKDDGAIIKQEAL